MATATLLSGPTTDTGNTPNSSGSFTPTLNDLLVVIVTKEASALSSPIVSADLSCSAGTTFTLVRTQGFGASAHQLAVFVANAKSAASSQTVTLASGADAGGGTIIAVYGIAGMTFTGSSAIRQSGGETDQASGEVPSVNFGTGVALTGNLIIGTVGVVDNTPGLLAPASFQTVSEAGYTTGATQGISNTYRNSGHTSQTVAWQTNTTGGSYATIIVELDTSTGTSYTDRRLGQIDLTGAVRETFGHSYTNRRSGQVDVTGTRREASSRISKVTGTISLLGSRRESLSHTDSLGGGAVTYESSVLALPNIALYWKLDAVDLADDLADAHDGTASGPTIGGFADGPPIVGESDSSTEFDGVDDYVEAVGYSPFTNGTVRTFFGWAYRAHSSDYHRLIGDLDGDSLVLWTGGQNVVYTGSAGGDITWTNAWPGNTEWVFFALVNNTAGNATLYINGDIVSGQASGNYIGAGKNFAVSASIYGQAWEGMVAHVAVVEGVLTTQQIADLYDVAINGGVGGIGALITLSGTVSESWEVAAPVSNTDSVTGTISILGSRRESLSHTDSLGMGVTTYEETVLALPSISLYWKLDAVDGIDDLADAHDGTASGPTIGGHTATYPPIVGEPESCTDFDGQDDKITSSYGPYTASTVRTFMGWVSKDTAGASMAIFAAATGTPKVFLGWSGDPNLYFEINATDAVYYASNGGITTGDGSWHFLVFVFDAAANTLSYYRNGSLVGSPLTIGAGAAGEYSGAGNFQIAEAGSSIPLDGKMGHVAVLEGGLTSEQIADLYDVAINGGVGGIGALITLSGTVSEQNFTSVTYTEKVTGTISISGASREQNSQTAKSIGTVLLSGQATDSHAISSTDRTTGTITITGTVSESWSSLAPISYTDSPTGQITLSGSVRESKTATHRATGQITLSGSVRESWALGYIDRRSGQIDISGSVSEQYLLATVDRSTGTIVISGAARESSSQTSKGIGTIVLSGSLSDRYVGATTDLVTGQITLTGAVREQYLAATTDRVTGTISLSGAARESHAVSRTEKVIGTVQVTGSLTDSFQISGGTQTVTPTGTIQLLGTRRESQTQSVKTTGTINISGQVRETFTGPSFSDSVTGTVTLAGTWRESQSRRVLRTGTITVTGTISEQNIGATTDRRSGQIAISGTQSDYWESTRTERRTGTIVISGQMWENYLPSGVTIDKRTGTIVLSGSLLDIHSRWDFVDGERWPGSSDSRWQEDVGERWDLDPVA